MAKKPRREEVQKLIKGLLDSELPEIQSVANQLVDRIKQLEERSIKLQDLVTQIENLAVDESDALVDAKIHDLVTGLEKAFGERRKPSKDTVSESKVEAGAKAEGSVEAETKPEDDVDKEVEVADVKLKQYTTPDGLVIRKTRR